MVIGIGGRGKVDVRCNWSIDRFAFGETQFSKTGFDVIWLK